MASPKDDFLLEDEDEASTGLQVPPAGTSAMVTSPTTDTLDSVALEPPMTFDDSEKIEEVDNNLESSAVTEEEGYKMNEKPSQIKEEAAVSNVSSYFADSADNFFDSLGGIDSASSEPPNPNNDLFMSIVISKSEEDIRVSEMNATEIVVSDIKPALSSPNEEDVEGMRRQNSFLRKSEEFEQETEKLCEELEKSLAESSLDEEERKAETEPKESVTHVYHRERTTSACEPEPVAFEGEAETISAEDVEFNLAGVEEAEIEEMGKGGDAPSFMSQVSHSSDQPEKQTLQVEKEQIQGLVVGSTPSQMSPAGTPIHQPGARTADADGASSEPLSSASANQVTSGSGRPVFDSQTSVPGSPFHQPSLEPVNAASSSSVFGPFNTTSGPIEDPFSSILSMSDADRRHDAWIPSDATSHILKAVLTSNGQATYAPAVEQLSTPGLISSEPLGDPVRDLVLRYMGEQEALRRSVLTVDSVTQDLDGLQKLIDAGCLRAAVDLTGRLLEQVGQGSGKAGQVTVHTPHSLQLWSCRFALMIKLRMFEQAEAEMLAFQALDTPDLYFQFYPGTYPGRRGSMVSFSMRLLHAELPLLCGRSQETLDRLYYMLAVCQRIKTNLAADLSEDGSTTHMTFEARKASSELWNKREIDITYKIGSAMLSVKDYEGALVIYNSLLEKDKKSHLELMEGIGRIHLQMGNIAEATRIMKEVESQSSKTESTLSCHNLINRGLVAMCGANFFDAYQHFKSAVQMQPHNTCAVNNMAVCSLYLGRLKDALNTLEQLVHSDPSSTLHEGVLFNLCTLYELETSRALHKKQAILDLVSKHKGDGFPVACLKMA